MSNSADPDQLASSEANNLELHWLQKQGISGFSRTRVKISCGHQIMPPPSKKLFEGHIAFGLFVRLFIPLSVHLSCYILVSRIS